MNESANPVLPAAARAHLETALAAHARRDLAGAWQALQQGLAIAPGDESLLVAMATVAMDARDWQNALPILQGLDSRFPGRHRARLALTLFNLARYADALPLLAALVDAGQTDISCILAYAACLERTGDESAAIGILEQVYKALPSAEFAVHLNSALMRVGRYDLVGERLPQLLADHPDNPQLLSALSEHAFNAGDYARGFDLMHHRWTTSLEPSKAAQLGCPDWDGKRFDGTLLVTAEQGLGDEILSSSVFPELVRLGQSCLIDCEARLLPLLRRSFPTLAFTDRKGNALADAARAGNCRRIDALELGRYFRRENSDFPARAGWLTADAARSAALRAQLQQQFPGQRLIGVSWRSARAFLGDAKSIPLTELAPLLRLPDSVFIDLQYGDTSADLAALQAATGLRVHHLDDIDNTRDIDGLAALIAALDCVVSSSNTTVHVAGALGKPVYAMIPGSRYVLWYWGYEGDRTRWYPSVRLYRGPGRKSWQALAGEVAADIRATDPRGPGAPSP